MNDSLSVKTQNVLLDSNIVLHVRREDLIHPYISGNKYRKLKYNILAAIEDDFNTLLTFGGAYSNHIAALAYAGKRNGLNTIGVIRGEELIGEIDENPTLRFAQECGMQLHFLTRTTYKLRGSEVFIESLKKQFGNFYLVPEGGTNALAIKGCEEILKKEDTVYDFICCAVGTGGTVSGIINSASNHQKVLGFSALKGDFLKNDISNFVKNKNWQLITDYHFGGYAKINTDLVTFINQFRKMNAIPLDPVYTGKMMYGVLDMIKSGFFPEHSKILAIHTGGLQGIDGMNRQLKKRNLPLIEVDEV